MLDGEHIIVQRAVRGEASAFGRLYDHYQPKIYRFVLLKVGQREEAEDLTHEVFVRAWQGIGKYADLGFPFSSWLYQIARNHVIDHYRTKREHARIEDTDPEYFAATGSSHAALEGKIETERLQKALQNLKPEYQDVLIMRFVEELSLKETAIAIGKSEGAVKLIQHRAVKALQELLS